MDCVFFKSVFKGIDSIVLENESLRLEWLPSYGAKLASIVAKIDGKHYELLYQSTADEIIKPDYGEAFSKYDSSGFDECFPSIDPCEIFIKNSEGFNKVSIPDHGEVWAMPWEYNQLDESTLEFKVTSHNLGYSLVKTVSLCRGSINFHYSLILEENISLLPFIWTPHALFKYDDSTHLIIPDRMNRVFNVCPEGGFLGEYGNIHSYPIANDTLKGELDLSLFESKNEMSCEKFYFENILEEGDVFGFENRIYRVLLSVNEKVSPYLGVWKNQGAFGEHHNFALEPCSGIYDSVEEAEKNKTCAIATNKEPTHWYFNIKVLKK